MIIFNAWNINIQDEHIVSSLPVQPASNCVKKNYKANRIHFKLWRMKFDGINDMKEFGPICKFQTSIWNSKTSKQKFVTYLSEAIKGKPST